MDRLTPPRMITGLFVFSTLLSMNQLQKLFLLHSMRQDQLTIHELQKEIWQLLTRYSPPQYPFFAWPLFLMALTSTFGRQSIGSSSAVTGPSLLTWVKIIQLSNPIIEIQCVPDSRLLPVFLIH